MNEKFIYKCASNFYCNRSTSSWCVNFIFVTEYINLIWRIPLTILFSIAQIQSKTDKAHQLNEATCNQFNQENPYLFYPTTNRVNNRT